MPPAEAGAQGGGSQGRLLPLEALRGMAALCVVLHHFALSFLPQYTGLIAPVNPGKALTGSPWFVIINGKAMFIVFFVLSGYVLALKGLRPNAGMAIADAAVKRWPRLLPLACISVLLSYALFRFGLYHFTDAAALTGSSWLKSVALGGFTQHSHPGFLEALYQGTIGNFLSGECAFNTNLWTMQPELLGSYMVFALALLLKPRMRLRLWCLMPFLGVWLLMQFIWMFPFLIGVLAASLSLDQVRLTKLTAFMLLGAGLYLCGYYFPTGAYAWLAAIPLPELTLRYLVLGMGGFLLVVVMSTHNVVSDRFQGPVSRFLGKISFPLYVVHAVIIASFASYEYLMAPQEWQRVPAAALAFLAVALPLSMALANLDRWWLSLLSGWHPFKSRQSI